MTPYNNDVLHAHTWCVSLVAGVSPGFCEGGQNQGWMQRGETNASIVPLKQVVWTATPAEFMRCLILFSTKTSYLQCFKCKLM